MEQFGGFALREAKSEDFAFALKLYLGTMEPLLSALGAWNEAHYRERLARSYTPETSRIISRAGEDIGWMQVLERPEEFNLAQFHILEVHRGTGIGTELMQQLLARAEAGHKSVSLRSEEHTSELQSLMRISYAVFCLKKKKTTTSHTYTINYA